MQTIKIKRRAVANLLDSVREMLAARKSPEEIEAFLSRGFNCLSDGTPVGDGFPPIPPLSVCHHENEAHMDNCMACAPRWGFQGPRIQIT